MIPICWKCGNPIENELDQSKEHIFLDSLCGTNRLSSDILLHKVCNSELGSIFDSEVVNQLGSIPLMLGLNCGKRNKDEDTLELKDNQDNIYKFGIGLKGLYTIKVQMPSGRISIFTANSKAEVIRVLILKAEKQYKWNKETIEEIHNLNFDFTSPNTYFKWPINEVGGKIFLHQMTKTAINFARLHNIEFTYLETAINSVKHYNTIAPLAAFYKLLPEPIKYSDDEVSHSIFLLGDSSARSLICFISLFGIYHVIVWLNKDYSGSYIKQKFSYDILQQKEIEKEFDVKISKDALNRIFNSSTINCPTTDDNLERVIGIIERNQSPNSHIKKA